MIHRPTSEEIEALVPPHLLAEWETRGRRGKETALYRARDSEGHLLYVGITQNVERRFAAHRSSSRWWPHMTSTSIEWHRNRWYAETAELIAIRTESAQYNSLHPARLTSLKAPLRRDIRSIQESPEPMAELKLRLSRTGTWAGPLRVLTVFAFDGSLDIPLPLPLGEQ